MTINTSNSMDQSAILVFATVQMHSASPRANFMQFFPKSHSRQYDYLYKSMLCVFSQLRILVLFVSSFLWNFEEHCYCNTHGGIGPLCYDHFNLNYNTSSGLDNVSM